MASTILTQSDSINTAYRLSRVTKLQSQVDEANCPRNTKSEKNCDTFWHSYKNI